MAVAISLGRWHLVSKSLDVSYWFGSVQSGGRALEVSLEVDVRGVYV